ncbi:hypothetical protein [Olleya namhaensis]|uniref:Lipoprotein n=1 Tax=Olleya namhaensis TaxID=1144750 RepID=A0A1I3TBI6_9FLAO|nr:hypothetical protein [Olleya namhaensis]SFJ67036.1 hypothetical protein SAMN05443431_1165 [Olleya namhaensis]
MNKILVVFLILGFYSCGEKQKAEKKTESLEIEKTVFKLKGFELLKDFEKNKAEFGTDTFELFGHSSEGGELKVFHNKIFDYVVYDFWLYGETGKLNYTYWAEKNGKLNFKLIKKLEYNYNKPFYENGYKTDSIIRYLSYSNSKVKLYDLNKTEIKESEKVQKTKLELESFFKDLTKEIEIIK